MNGPFQNLNYFVGKYKYNTNSRTTSVAYMAWIDILWDTHKCSMIDDVLH